MKNSAPPDQPPPILMKMEGKLVFTADGVWLHDGAPITHEKLRDYFSAHLRFSPEHKSYVVEVDGKCVPAEVEDTPIVVRTIQTSTTPWNVHLSNGTVEQFAPGTLEATPAGVFYCRIKHGTERARILRPAWQALLPFVIEAADGAYVFHHAGKDYLIVTHEPSSTIA